MRNRPPGATPMSAEVPPTSSVITFSVPAARPIQMPPTIPAAGPDMRSDIGRPIAPSTVTTPPFEAIRWNSVSGASAAIASRIRAR